MMVGKSGDQLLCNCCSEDVFRDGWRDGGRGKEWKEKSTRLMTTQHVVFVVSGKKIINGSER